MNRQPLASLLIDADLQLKQALGPLYHSGIPFQLANHLLKFARQQGIIQGKTSLNGQQRGQLLADLDRGEHGDALAVELARYVESIAKGEPRAQREGQAIPGLRFEE